MTFAAIAPVFAVDIGVGFVVFVAHWAKGLAAIDGSSDGANAHTSTDVFAMGDRLKMRVTDAGTISTEVVWLHVGWKWPVFEFERDPMGLPQMSPEPKSAVTISTGGRPNPASPQRRVDGTVLLVDLRPKAREGVHPRTPGSKGGGWDVLSSQRHER